MRSVMLLVAGASALVLAACDGKVAGPTEHRDRPMSRPSLRVISKLDCPERQGALRRVNVAPNGLSCGYAGGDAEVTLKLLALNGGDAQMVLDPIEAELKTLIPAQKSVMAKNGKAGKQTKIELPGMTIDTNQNGSDINIGQISINTHGEGAEVKIGKNLTAREDAGDANAVNIVSTGEEDGDVNIRAGDHGAEIRHRRGGDAIRATLILAADKAPSGYRVVGYEARGPKGGPLAVAVVKAKQRNTDDHDVFKDMKALIRHNVGG